MSSNDAAVPAAASPATDDRQRVQFGFENAYARLPERFFVRQNPVPVAQPRLVKVNAQLAHALRLDAHALESCLRSGFPHVNGHLAHVNDRDARPGHRLRKFFHHPKIGQARRPWVRRAPQTC